jgi:hypothetical protein
MMQSKRRRRKILEAGGEKRPSTEKHIIFIDAGNDLDIYPSLYAGTFVIMDGALCRKGS